jgi:CheY-like chemotaxis protein
MIFLDRRCPGVDIRTVFSDIDMPGSMDGMKLAAAVRDRWPPIEIIIVSGHRRPVDRDLPARATFFRSRTMSMQ